MICAIRTSNEGDMPFENQCARNKEQRRGAKNAAPWRYSAQMPRIAAPRRYSAKLGRTTPKKPEIARKLAYKMPNSPAQTGFDHRPDHTQIL